MLAKREISKLTFYHTIVLETAPHYLIVLKPHIVGQDVSYNLRNINTLQEQPAKTEKFKQSLIPHTTKLWNQLNASMSQILDNKIFARKLKLNPIPNEFFSWIRQKKIYCTQDEI